MHLMLGLVMSFSDNPDDTFSKVFLFVTLLMLVLVRSFSCTPDANFSEELTSLYYSHHAGFSEEFLLHSPY